MSVPSESLFEGVIGQDRAVASLLAAARRPVHAYLFVGPSGTGSRAAVGGFAAALLCPSGGCGKCNHCTRALKGTHPDLVFMERTGVSLSTGDARHLVGIAQRRPLEAQRQVLVVADVHLATRSAPTLLKTLEEPPSATVFILLSDDVPPELITVASRCVEIPFPPVSRTIITKWLESRGTDPVLSAIVAESCGGDIQRARLLVEDDGFASRLELWRSVPNKLNGTGTLAGELARLLQAGADDGLTPLRAHHASELDEMAAEAKSMGEKAIPGRKEVIDRQHRQERRWRSDEIRIGLGVMARAYRDSLAESLSSTTPSAISRARGCARAVDLIVRTTKSLTHNPNESLMLESLLSRLSHVFD